MKKKLFKKLKDAYFEELKKMGVINSAETKVIEKNEAKTYQGMTKAELIEEGKAIGINLDVKQTKAEMISAIESFGRPVEKAEE